MEANGINTRLYMMNGIRNDNMKSTLKVHNPRVVILLMCSFVGSSNYSEIYNMAQGLWTSCTTR